VIKTVFQNPLENVWKATFVMVEQLTKRKIHVHWEVFVPLEVQFLHHVEPVSTKMSLVSSTVKCVLLAFIATILTDLL
jgi:hypothetical protein